MKRWSNPYDSLRSNSTKAELAMENYQRVQRRKAEQIFLSGLKSNYGLERLQEIAEELQTREAAVTSPTQRTRHIPTIKALPAVPAAVAPLRWTQEIPGHVRAVEITHHGATLWSAENDGSVTVRSGGNGLVVYTIPPQASGATVDTLYATSTHMWLGLSDGTVQVYDHLVYIHVTEGKFHDARVTSFCETFDGRVFSGSLDGSLVKWDSELRNFEAITKIIPGQKDVVALASAGYTLFSASSDGTVVALDIETGQHAAQYSSMSHTQPVTCLIVEGDALFSGSSDGSLRVWNARDGALLLEHIFESGVSSAVPDSVSRKLWVALADGEIKVLRSSIADNFAVEQTVTSHKGRPIVALRGYCSVDSVRLWTFASNGINKIWSSSRNLVEQGIVATADALKGVIAQDTIELDKWRALVTRLENVDQRRKVQLAEALALAQADKLRRRYVWTWRQVVQRRHRERRAQMVSARLAAEEQLLFMRRMFSKWFRWYRTSQNVRLREKFSEVLEQTTKRSVVLNYFRRMQVFARTMKNALQRSDLVSVLGAQNGSYLSRIYLRKWLKFRNTRATANRRQRYAEQLVRVSESGVLRLFYCKWLDFLANRKVKEHKRKFGETLLHMTAAGNRRIAFLKWLKFAQQRHRRVRVKAAAEVLLLNTHNGLLASYFAKLKSYRAVCAARRHKEAASLVGEELAAMREKYAALEALMAERREVERLKAQLEQQDVELQQRRMKLDHLRSERDQLARDLEQKQQDDSARVASVQEQLESLMAKLKAKVINFYADQPLFHQVREKLKQGQPVSKVFLEAHQAVKRVVVELTRKPHLGVTEHWPLSNEQLRRMPSHQTSVVLTAIKTMIVTFDVMDKDTRDGMTTDQEIVTNADWLLLMAEICAMHRRKAVTGGK